MSDYAIFASHDFNPNEYAHAVLAGEPYPSQQTSKPKAILSAVEPAKEDISVAITKLNSGIDDVSKQLKNVVTTHHEQLLIQAAGVTNLEESLHAVRSGLAELDASLEKLRLKIRVPYQALQGHVNRLHKLQQASDVLRRISRFLILARRLELQMAELNRPLDTPIDTPAESAKTVGASYEEFGDEKERTIAKAALTIAELTTLYEDPIEPVLEGEERPSPGFSTGRISLRSVNVVNSHIASLDNARLTVTSQMEALVLSGLETLDRSALASSLQTAHNLRVLPELVQSLVAGLSNSVDERIRYAFDTTRISREMVGKEHSSAGSLLYKSRVRTEPTTVTAPQFTALIWGSLESLIDEMTVCCIKVYTLEKVLKLKKDPGTGIMFLDEAMKLLENNPTATFWTSLGRSLEKCAKDASKASSFLQTTLGSNYPRLLRLIHEFFAKVAVHTDTVYSQAHQSPETILVLRSFSVFETSFITRCSNRVNEEIGRVFSGGIRNPPGMTEGVTIGRAVANELDAAKFDPLLSKTVGKGMVTSLEQIISRWSNLVTWDRTVALLSGPSATPQQISNAQLVSFLYQCWSRLVKLKDECSEEVFDLLRPVTDTMREQYEKVVDPVFSVIKRDCGAILATMHRLDFGKSGPAIGGGGASVYMEELTTKLNFVKQEILERYTGMDVVRQWIISIVKYVIRTFVLHVSITKPLGETGKLQLTSDMTELEFALSAFMADKSQPRRRSGGDWSAVADDYRALRAMRPLLFLDNNMLASPQHTAGLQPLIVLHHILVRSPIPLPHSLHGWAESEYVKWVDEHSEEESWTLIESGLSHWEKTAELEGREAEDAAGYAKLARVVLANAKEDSGN